MAPVADLHVHTTVSDGRLTLAELPERAREAGLAVVAVTDHDRIHPGLDAPVTARDDVTVVRGVELRVDAGDLRVDLLGYGVERTDALVSELDRVQRDRVERATRMVDCVEAETGASLDVALEPGVGRPHVAAAVEASDAPYDAAEAFAELIGTDGPCYVARDLPGFERGAELLRNACGLVALAHPLRYPDPERALALAPTLDGVERHYPYDGPTDATPVERAVATHDLVPTGGSDAHGRTLGAAGLDCDAWERVAVHLPETQS